MSTLRVDSIQSLVGSDRFPSHAWINFNGTGTIAIRADGNVSSLTDNGVGSYSVNYSTVFADTSYAPTYGFTNEVNVQHGVGFLGTISTSSTQLNFFSVANSANTVDKAIVSMIVAR